MICGPFVCFGTNWVKYFFICCLVSDFQTSTYRTDLQKLITCCISQQSQVFSVKNHQFVSQGGLVCLYGCKMGLKSAI